MPTKYRGHATINIGVRAAENVLHAVRYTAETGRPINTQITISFATLGIDDSRAGVLFKSLKERVARWWTYERSKGRLHGDFLRGIHAAYEGYFHIRAEDEGSVLGRRTGVSRAINMAARKRANWKRKRSRSARRPPRPY